MKLVNHIDISDQTIREMIQFVKPSGIAGFDVRIGNSNNDIARGTAYPEGCPGYHGTRSTSNEMWIYQVESRRKRFQRY
jgi:hypothetical protein